MSRFGGQVINRRDFDFWDDQKVMGCLGIYVLTGENPVIFEDNVSGDFTTDDFSKKCCHNASIFDNVPNMSKKLFVGNLPFDVNDADLVTVLGVVGEVVSARVVINRKSGRSKGYAFVEMATEELAQEAIKKFEGATLNERALTVQLATPKQEADAKAEGAPVITEVAKASASEAVAGPEATPSSPESLSAETPSPESTT